MIRGAPYWNDRDCYYTQTNNPTESYLLAAGHSDWLESCGPTAAVNCMAALGYDLSIICPGVYRPQPEEVLMDYFNDPRNAADLRAVRNIGNSIPENRVPQYYPLGCRNVFDADCSFCWVASFGDIAEEPYDGNSVMICFRDPGHYIAVVAVDDDREELIYNDPWPGRYPDGNGFNRRLSKADFETEMHKFAVVFMR